tara:strand:- start:1230 stop:2111 length:882 start_codon:yes stop_codon:yes gene_type:complete
MAVSVVKETIELEQVTTDASGNAYLTKRINLDSGKRHQLVQVDTFVDAYPSINHDAEIVITPYPAIPTNMQYETVTPHTNRYPAGGDDSVLFKERYFVYNSSATLISKEQFPSAEIAALNTYTFYTDHVFVNIHLMADPNTVISNIAYSFLMVLNDKSVSVMEHSLGVLSEQHDAMCAQVMSNGRMRSRNDLLGNVFPMWRFGGIRPENTFTPLAANTFFLDIASRDEEQMVTSAAIRTNVADARQMSAYDAAFGIRRPDWLREFLNAGYEAGPIRANPVPLRYADNGNTRMF